jgi:hypothetical protein
MPDTAPTNDDNPCVAGIEARTVRAAGFGLP